MGVDSIVRLSTQQERDQPHISSDATTPHHAFNHEFNLIVGPNAIKVKYEDISLVGM